jgi:hypothetical protein
MTDEEAHDPRVREGPRRNDRRQLRAGSVALGATARYPQWFDARRGSTAQRNRAPLAPTESWLLLGYMNHLGRGSIVAPCHRIKCNLASVPDAQRGQPIEELY